MKRLFYRNNRAANLGPGYLGSRGRALVSVMFEVKFRCLRRMVGSVVQVSVGGVRVVRGAQMVAGLVMLRGFMMMPGGMFIMFCCFAMVLCCFLRHK